MKIVRIAAGAGGEDDDEHERGITQNAEHVMRIYQDSIHDIR